jgi:hypothetical protein
MLGICELVGQFVANTRDEQLQLRLDLRERTAEIPLAVHVLAEGPPQSSEGREGAVGGSAESTVERVGNEGVGILIVICG